MASRVLTRRFGKAILSIHEGAAMTKGQLEAAISEAVARFERDQMGRGPKQIKTTVTGDLIIIRLTGFLSPSERHLAKNQQGIELLKKMRTSLFEASKEYLINAIINIINIRVVSVHSDVSTVTGEKVILFVIDHNLEDTLDQ